MVMKGRGAQISKIEGGERCQPLQFRNGILYAEGILSLLSRQQTNHSTKVGNDKLSKRKKPRCYKHKIENLDNLKPRDFFVQCNNGKITNASKMFE